MADGRSRCSQHGAGPGFFARRRSCSVCAGLISLLVAAAVLTVTVLGVLSVLAAVSAVVVSVLLKGFSVWLGENCQAVGINSFLNFHPSSVWKLLADASASTFSKGVPARASG